jgi:hypothetical protein
LGTFFGTLNLAAMGIAISSQKAGFICLISTSMLAFIYLDQTARRLLAHLYLRGLRLQDSFASADGETFLSLVLVGRWRSQIERVANARNENRAYIEVDDVPFVRRSFSGFWVPLAVGVFELILGIVLWRCFDWGLF